MLRPSPGRRKNRRGAQVMNRRNAKRERLCTMYLTPTATLPARRIRLIVSASLLVLSTSTGLLSAHPPFGITVNLALDWDDEKTCDLRVTLTGLRINTSSNPVEPQKILVEAVDAIGNPVGAAPIMELNYPLATGPEGVQIDEVEVFVVEPDSDVERIRVKWWDNGNTGDEPTGFKLKDIPDYCPDIQNATELAALNACGACVGTDALPTWFVRTFKSSRTVYALRRDHKSQATYGETVSSRFKAPRCGILKVQVQGSNDNCRVFLEDWNGQGTLAVNGTDYIKKLEKDDMYKFSVQAYEAGAGDVTVLLDWYTWKSDKPPGDHADCLMHYEYSEGGAPGLRFPIQELVYKPNRLVVPGMPPILSGQPHQETAGGATTKWYEVNIPCDESGSSMTDTFILPIGGDGPILDGHAIGWRKTGATLVAPGSDGKVFDVAGF